MSITREQALEALEALKHDGPHGWGPIEHFTTLREYIQQSPQAAPQYGTIAERAEQGLRDGWWKPQAAPVQAQQAADVVPYGGTITAGHGALIVKVNADGTLSAAATQPQQAKEDGK